MTQPALFSIDEQIVADTSVICQRIAHPDHVQDGHPSSLVFKLGSRDFGKLSTFLSSKLDAREAFDRYKATRPGAASVWGVSVAEANDLGFNVIDDGNPVDEPGGPLPFGHASIDMTNIGRSAADTASRRLRDRAKDRGVLYEP